jgi:hypothetical protein
MLSTRNRVNPPATGSFHRILAIFGLGPSGNADAEAVTVVADRMKFAAASENRLLTNAGTSEAYAESDWLPCVDRALARFKIEYRGAGVRQFLIAWKAHDAEDSFVLYSRILEPDNSGLSGGDEGGEGTDLGQSGNFLAVGQGQENVDVRGMAAVKLILLAGDGPAVDAWGAVG